MRLFRALLQFVGAALGWLLRLPLMLADALLRPLLPRARAPATVPALAELGEGRPAQAPALSPDDRARLLRVRPEPILIRRVAAELAAGRKPDARDLGACQPHTQAWLLSLSRDEAQRLAAAPIEAVRRLVAGERTVHGIPSMDEAGRRARAPSGGTCDRRIRHPALPSPRAAAA